MSDSDNGYVLVVEDTSSMRMVHEGLLRQMGFEAVGVEDGLQAIEQMLKRPPALVLLDLELPKLDGFEVLGLLRKHDELKRIPVIACTAHAEREYVVKAIQAGVTDFICKPVERNELRARIEKHLPVSTPLETDVT